MAVPPHSTAVPAISFHPVHLPIALLSLFAAILLSACLTAPPQPPPLPPPPASGPHPTPHQCSLSLPHCLQKENLVKPQYKTCVFRYCMRFSSAALLKSGRRRKAMLTKTTSISVISAWTVKISDVVKVISVATVARALVVVTAD